MESQTEEFGSYADVGLKCSRRAATKTRPTRLTMISPLALTCVRPACSEANGSSRKDGERSSPPLSSWGGCVCGERQEERRVSQKMRKYQ